MSNPTIISKTADHDGYLQYDWSYEMVGIGAISIVTSTWQVLSGSITIDGYQNDGYRTTTTVHGGIPWEYTQLSNTVTFDNSNVITKIFTLIITKATTPNFAYPASTRPSLIGKALGNNLPFSYDWAAEMASFGASSIETSFWVVLDGSILIEHGRSSIVEGSIATTYISGGVPWEQTSISNSVMFDTGDQVARSFTIIITPTGYNQLAGILLDQQLDQIIGQG
jgi:hypothetical protein